MIVDSPTVIQLALGTDRRVMEEGDSRLVVPSMVLPTLDLIQPTRAAQSNTELQRTSFIALTSDARTNQAANTTTLCTVEKGLWSFTFTLSARSNYISGTLVNGADLTWNNGSFSIQLLSRLPVGTPAVPQSTVDILQIQLLLPEQATFELRLGITGVGQTMEAVLRLIANRIL